ncbi:hypothetical protein QBA54_07545 [Streptomyces sp. B21-108]|uniref:hypothetical protein n=1 Tax=Streptomyces sp. B21-108 TaxID=3039419 RepID=UPI002FF1BEC6
MTPRTKARTCTLAALLTAAAGLYAATVYPILGGPGAAAAFSLWMVGRSYRRQHWAMVFRCEQARRAAIRFPDPQPIPDYDQLAEQAAFDEAFGDMINHWNEDAA